MKTGLACVGLVSLFLVTLVVTALAHGFVLSTMWGWFMVPLFHLPPMNIAYALGVSLVVGMWTSKTSSKSDSKDTSAIVSELVMATIGTPAIVLFFGWIVKQFLG